MINRLVLLPGMHGTGELFSEFMRSMPEPEQIETVCYPADANRSYDQLLVAVQSFVPTSKPYFLLASHSQRRSQFGLPQPIRQTSKV